MTNEVKTYYKNALIVGSVIGLAYFILVDILIRDRGSPYMALWDCFSFTLAVVVVDWLTKSKIFAS